MAGRECRRNEEKLVSQDRVWPQPATVQMRTQTKASEKCITIIILNSQTV